MEKEIVGEVNIKLAFSMLCMSKVKTQKIIAAAGERPERTSYIGKAHVSFLIASFTSSLSITTSSVYFSASFVQLILGAREYPDVQRCYTALVLSFPASILFSA